jgi:protein-L-isoaspartate(D-aspartate) O-methyltransferase
MDAGMDIERARYNMVEQQVRTWEVLDPGVLELMQSLPREDFVPEQHRLLAYADLELPIGHGEVMLAPKLQGRIVQSLALGRADRVLEIGTGTGYLTALLARLAGQVVSVEIVPELSAGAARRLAALRIGNVELAVGDAARGWTGGRYEAIAITGSMPVLAPAWLDLLPAGGRLFAVLGDAPVMKALLIERGESGALTRTELFETCIPPLRNAPQPERFRF